MVGISHTYVSKIENEKLDFGDYPSEELILKIAAVLDADEDELLILAKKIPEHIRPGIPGEGQPGDRLVLTGGMIWGEQCQSWENRGFEKLLAIEEACLVALRTVLFFGGRKRGDPAFHRKETGTASFPNLCEPWKNPGWKRSIYPGSPPIGASCTMRSV